MRKKREPKIDEEAELLRNRPSIKRSIYLITNFDNQIIREKTWEKVGFNKEQQEELARIHNYLQIQTVRP